MGIYRNSLQPYQPEALFNILTKTAQKMPNKVAIVDTAQSYTYAEFENHVNQLANLNSVLDFLAEDFILVLDDANFQGVVSSADEFVETNNLRPLFRRKILTSVVEDDKDWWNGLYILVLSKS